MKEPPNYRARFMVRLVSHAPSPYVIVADTLAKIRGKLPYMLERSERQPDDLPEVVEIWYSA